MYVYIYTHTHTHIHIYTYIHVYAYIYIHAYIYMYTCVCIVYNIVYIYTVYMYICTCLPCVYVCIYLCIYFTYRDKRGTRITTSMTASSWWVSSSSVIPQPLMPPHGLWPMVFTPSPVILLARLSSNLDQATATPQFQVCLYQTRVLPRSPRGPWMDLMGFAT